MKYLNEACELVYKHGISVIPLGLGDKRPRVEWERWQSELPTAKEMSTWGDCNIGIVTGAISGICVIDCENYEDAKWFTENRGRGGAIVATPRGFHLYFRHPGGKVSNAIKIKDEGGSPRYDVRADGGYVVAPPSLVLGKPYIWKRPLGAELPEFNRAWRPENFIQHKPANVTYSDENATIKDGAAYISHIYAVSGQSGHNSTFRAACRLKDSGLSQNDALAVLLDWNQTNALPPWTENQLAHKVKSAYRRF